MNRRDFGRTASFVAAVAVAAPHVLADKSKYAHPTSPAWDERAFLKECGCTPDQIEAIERMEQFRKRVSGIFGNVAKEFPRMAPDASDKSGWVHGAYRIAGGIGAGYVDLMYPRFIPSTDLSDIHCVGFWRQAVRNKHTQEIKYFASWTPSHAAEVYPGREVTIKEDVKIAMSDKEISDIARKSLAKLQELVVEFYNAEA